MKTRRRRGQKRKTRKERGGSLIGKGAYGCVYQPSIRCSTEPSSPFKITKVMDEQYALEEFEQGQAIATYLTEKGEVPDMFFVLPTNHCTLPTNYSNAEEVENPIQKCNILRVPPPHLITMEYGGMAMDKVRIPIDDQVITTIDSLFSATVQLLKKLATLHRHNIVHLDIKTPNLLLRMYEGMFDIRFIDLGFVQIMDRFNPSELNRAIELDYFVWPFETRYLKKDIQIAPQSAEIASFLNKSVGSLTKILGFNDQYYTKQGIPLFGLRKMKNGPTFLMDILDFYKEMNPTDRAIAIAKQTDVYSMGLTLVQIFQVIKKVFLGSPGIEEVEDTLFRSVIDNMITPDPRVRITAETAYRNIKEFYTSYFRPTLLQTQMNESPRYYSNSMLE